MTEIIWLGRGRQGAFTAAKLFRAAYAGKNSENHTGAFRSY